MIQIRYLEYVVIAFKIFNIRTEQIDGNALHTRLWPRAAALAERLWSNPDQDWTAASLRMNHHRDRLARIVPVELVQPKWCYQNDGYCD